MPQVRPTIRSPMNPQMSSPASAPMLAQGMASCPSPKPVGWRPAPQPARRRTALLVLGLHALALLGLSQAYRQRPPPNARASSASLELRLLAPRPESRQQPPTTITLAPPPRPELAAPLTPPDTPPQPTADASPGAPSSMRLLADGAPAAPAASASAASAATPLKLDLPRGALQAADSMAAQATRDPRSNSPRLSVEARIAAALGGGTITEERLLDGRLRMRNGRGGCVLLEQPRVAQLNPMDERWRNQPWTAKPCPK